MRVLALDVWQDLRDKRLWPVALALLVALVAAPVALLAGEEEASPGAPARPPADARTAVTLAGANGGAGSELEAFSPSDPFKPDTRGRAGERLAGAQPAASTPAPEAGSPAPAAGSPAPAPAPTAPQATPSTPSSPSTPSTTPDEPESRLLTDAVDVTFGGRGSERARRGVTRLEPLPTSGEPVATFLGATPSGHSAVFLLQAGLEVGGDGACRPSRAECTFLTLRPDRRHDQAFLRDAQGRKWSLRLDALERVPLEDVVEDEPPGARSSRSRSEEAPALGATVEVAGARR